MFDTRHDPLSGWQCEYYCNNGFSELIFCLTICRKLILHVQKYCQISASSNVKE